MPSSKTTTAKLAEPKRQSKPRSPTIRSQFRSEEATKALHCQEFVTRSLREIHSSVCTDNPTVEENAAQAHLLQLIKESVELQDKIKFLTS